MYGRFLCIYSINFIHLNVKQYKALFHNVDHHYSVISELCTADSCPTMTGPGASVFLWVDERGKKIKCSAPQYIGLPINDQTRSHLNSYHA